MKKNSGKTVKTAAIVSLGCPKNLVDTELAAGAFLREGFGLTSFPEEADILFINTCAFLESAREEACREIADAEVWKAVDPEGRRIIVAGCLNEWNGSKNLRKKYPFVDRWTRLDSTPDMGKIAKSLYSGKQIADPEGPPSYIYDAAADRLQLTPSHYAYLKIADGCDNCCAYCLIPSIRGGLRSRTEKSVLREAENMLSGGVKELIVTAQDTSAFRRDKNDPHALAELLRKLDKFGGEYWIRVMYIHPAGVTEELCDALAECSHLARCIEMPIQHISDKILLSMGRKIGEEATKKAVSMLQERANCRLRTTVMTGFPGETPADYKRLRDYVAEGHFIRLGSFSFSPEKGTRAAAMPGQVSPAVSEKRRREIMEIQEEISLAYNRSLRKQTLRLIADSREKGDVILARSMNDAPEIDNTIRISHAPAGLHPGMFFNAEITRASAYTLSGTALQKEEK